MTLQVRPVSSSDPIVPSGERVPNIILACLRRGVVCLVVIVVVVIVVVDVGGAIVVVEASPASPPAPVRVYRDGIWIVVRVGMGLVVISRHLVQLRILALYLEILVLRL